MVDDSHNLQVQVASQLVELSLQRSYMNTERTLAVWTRTALSLMIFGIAVDRFGLLLRHPPWHVASLRGLLPNPLSTLGGVVLVALGVLIL
ncbi:MAG: YidH family protein, partial [Rhodanobacteraceae bacterium]